MERDAAAVAEAGTHPVGAALRIAGIVAAALFVALLVYGVLSPRADTTIDDGLARGEPVTAPGFTLDVLTTGSPGPVLSPVISRATGDGRLELEELAGRPVVVNYWASWCPPCREEAPLLERAWRDARAAGVVVLGLNMQDITEDARDYMREFDITFPNVRDPGNGVAREWGVTGLPETFFVDPRGRVVGHVVGAISAAQLRSGITAARSGRPLPRSQGGDRRSTR